MSDTSDFARAVRQELGGLKEPAILPDSPGYDEARAVYNAFIDRRPSVVARCGTPEEVATVVDFASRRGQMLAVRGGGHNGAGLGTVDDGVVLDLSPMRDISVDPDARTVRVAGGCTWGEVHRATDPYSLATPAGIISTTGVGGLALGGGLGHLARTCGLTIDNILEVDMVLANGDRVRANADENPDLYWAIRGGGGNFGVVTSFLFRLHDVGTVIAGPTLWSIEQSAEVLAAYSDFISDAPRELNGFFMYASVPPAPPFPEELHLRKVCGVVWCYVGSETSAANAMAPLLDSLPEPLLHGVQPMPHADLQSAFDELYPPGDQWYWRADFVKDIPEAAIEEHAVYGEQMPTWKSTMHLYPISGAPEDVGPTETPWAYRDAKWGSVFAGVDPDPANAEAIKRWTIDYHEALHPYSAGGAYVNMMMDEGQERVRASYGDNYDRLARIKAEYDPANLFRVNQNIQPKA